MNFCAWTNLTQNFLITAFPPSKLFSQAPKMPSTHNHDKPWDTDDIDKWKVSNFSFFIFRVIRLIQDYRLKLSNLKIIWEAHSPKNRHSQRSSPSTVKSTYEKHGL